MMKCPKCATESEGCTYCPNCGMQLMYDGTAPASPPPVQNVYTNEVYQPPQPVQVVNQYVNIISNKSRLAALLLAIFLGVVGVHRFYVGKIGTGLLWLFTGGGFGIGYIVDIVLIACGVFKDGNGMPIVNW